jgi:hypothetical protein
MKGFYGVENKKLLSLIFFMTFARNRHCGKTFRPTKQSLAIGYRCKIASLFLLAITTFLDRPIPLRFRR